MSSGGDIPGDVRRLLATSLRSATELETVLFLRQNGGRTWTADELAAAVFVDRREADRLLFDLMARGFLSLVHQLPPAYRYRPKSYEFGRTVDRLAELYPERRVVITSLLRAQPNESLRLFSDAFRLRKED